MSRTAGPARAVCSGIVRFPFFIGYVQQSVTHADIKRQRKQKVSGGSRTRSLHVPGTNASNTKPRPLKIIFLPPLFQSVIHFSETVPSSVGLWLPSAPVVTETRSSYFSIRWIVHAGAAWQFFLKFEDRDYFLFDPHQSICVFSFLFNLPMLNDNFFLVLRKRSADWRLSHSTAIISDGLFIKRWKPR